MSDLATRLAFETHLEQHLSQLSQLVGRQVQSQDLLSVEESKKIRQKSKTKQPAPAWRCNLKFSEKSGDRFRKLVDALEHMNPTPVFIWTQLSSICGLLRPLPLLRNVTFCLRSHIHDT